MQLGLDEVGSFIGKVAWAVILDKRSMRLSTLYLGCMVLAVREEAKPKQIKVSVAGT